MEIRLADYIAQRLADYGVRHVFMLTGGGAMHLNDAFGRESRIQYICNHHEQACAMAAEGYSRVTGKIGVVNVTAGPGGINTLNGVFGAYTDSIPMLVVSGQVKRETLLRTHGLTGKLRQLGDQEVDIVAMIKNITKYAVTIIEPESIRYHLERALHLATSGRPGPCWIDVPVDVQGAKIDPDKLPAYDPAEDKGGWNGAQVKAQCRALAQRLSQAKRPALLVGSALYANGAGEAFEKVIRRLQIPVTTAWTAIDAMASDDPLYCGRPGVVGDRAGNFTVQNADLVIVVGCRLAIRQVSYNWQSFARHAFKVQVDIDNAELDKPMVKPDMGIHADCVFFFETLLKELDAFDSSRFVEWLQWCKERVAKYPVVQPKHRDPSLPVNPYHFTEVLFEKLKAGDIVACGDASASVVTFQAAAIKSGQRIFTNAGSASMGYDLPAAIGAACGGAGRRVICLAGEGSAMLNLQELQTLAYHRLPLKVIILNNGGYLSIRSTQQNFFKLLVGEGAESGVTFPDFVSLAPGFGLPGVRITNPGFEDQLDAFLREPGPGLAEIILDRSQGFEPKLSSRQLPDGRMVSSNLEDMAPFLDREELKSNLLFEEDKALCRNT